MIDIQHIRVWAISTTENAHTAHVTVLENISMPEIKESKKIEV